MRSRVFDPRRLDVKAFAQEAGHLDGSWPIADLGRLKSALFVSDRSPGDAQWAVDGEWRKPNSLDPQPWLHVHAQAAVDLECQRCLAAVRVPLSVDRYFRFVASEEAAAELDAEEEDDVLALPRHLDLQDLVDEELLLALPLVPRHEQCPEPLTVPDDPDLDLATEGKPNPFAALAGLKRGPEGQN